MAVDFSIPSYVNWSNVKRFGKMIPYYLGDGAVVQQEALENIVKGTKDATGKRVGGAGYRNLGSSIRKSYLETERAYKAVVAENGSFLKYVKNTLKNFPSELSGSWKTSSEAAKIAGKSATWAGIKGVGSTLLKRMPLIGSFLLLASEIPNIGRATVDGGLVSGATEAVKAGARITGFTAGGAIGQALIPIPIVGFIIGGMLGEKVASLLTGKSYTEQKEEIKQEAKQEAAQEIQQQLEGNAEAQALDTGSTNPFANGLTREQMAQLAQIEEMIANDPQFNGQGQMA